MVLLAAVAAHAEPVCASCTYTQIRPALEAGHSAIELTDAGRYEGFVHDLDQLGLVTVTNPTGGAWIDGATTILGGARLRIEGVPVVAPSGTSILSVSGAGSLLDLDGVVLDCEGHDATLGGAVAVESGALLRMMGGAILGCWASTDGGAIWAAGATVELSQGVELTDNAAAIRGGGLFLQDSQATLTDVRLERNGASEGGGLLAIASEVTLAGTTTFAANDATAGGGLKLTSSSTLSVSAGSGVVFERNRAATGGAVVLDGTAVPAPLAGLTFDGNSATDDGGALWSNETSLELTSPTFRDNHADGNGGAVAALLSDDFTVTGGSFTGDDATLGGAIFTNAVTTIAITGTHFEEPFASSSGGALEILAGGSVTITDNTFDRPRTEGWGGAADILLSEEVHLKRNLYCSPRAVFGGALSFGGSCLAGGCFVANERIHDAGAETGGALYAELASHVDASYLTVVAPQGSVGTADALSQLDVTQSVIQAADGDPIFLLGSADPATLPCGGVEFRLHPDSPLVGLGAYEGPSRDESFWTTDADADGVPLAYDCADERSPTVGGLLPELCDNDVDDDCDGRIDESDAIAAEPWWPDPDGDGYAAPGAKPGTACVVPREAVTDPTRLLDCSEGDPARFPGATEVADDGVDQDCNGHDARSFVAGGGGCGCHNAGGATAPWLLLALLSRRRRGSSRSRA